MGKEMSKKHPHEIFPKIRRINHNAYSEINAPPSYPILDSNGQPMPFIDASINFPYLAQQIAGYFEIWEDLNRGMQSLKRIHFLGTKDDVVLEALFSNAIIHYGRCFTQADRRKITLSNDNQWIKKGEEDEENHEQIMHLRHQFVAHAGETLFKEVKVYLLVDNEEEPTKLNGIDSIGRSLTTADLATTIRYVAHFERLATRVKMKIDELCALLREEAGSELKLNLEA